MLTAKDSEKLIRLDESVLFNKGIKNIYVFIKFIPRSNHYDNLM